jgi:ABC-type multidrug transport system fused ATPase/permease subunit
VVSASVRIQLAAGCLPAQAVVRHCPHRPCATCRVTTGEVAARSPATLRTYGLYETSQRFIGAVVLRGGRRPHAVPLGLLVLVGVPVLVLGLAPIVRPLQARQSEERDAVGQLTALGADTVAGLRVLRGIGGEQVFFGRYRERSQQVRQAGVRIAATQATLDAAQVLLPGIFLVL